MYDYQMFKTVRFKGFDRDEVIAFIQSQEEESNRKVADLQKEIKERDKMIEELKGRLVLKDAQRVALENEIETKYKKYIDNYDKIGALVYESQVKGDQMIADAKEQADKLVGDATKEADRLVSEATEKSDKMVGDATTEADRLVSDATAEAQKIRSEADEDAVKTRAAAAEEVEQKLFEGKQKYSQIQAILNDTVEMINQVQRRFMSSYKDVHELIAEVASERELANQVDGAETVPDDEFDDEDGVSFETGELNFDLREALLDTEDDDLDEIPVAYRAAASEEPDESPVSEAAEAADTEEDDKEALSGAVAEAAAADAAMEARDDAAADVIEALTSDEAESYETAEGAPDATADLSATEEMAQAVAEATARAAEETERELLSDVQPLEGENDAFFRGANV